MADSLRAVSEMTSYRAGTPSWIDLMPTDAEAARSFYGDLFGWEFDIGPEETGHYAMATVRGKTVAGIGGHPAPGAPVAWTTYFDTGDADAAAATIAEAGGTVVLAPMDVMDNGRLAVALDPGGAVFGLWQAGTHLGAQIVNEPVSLVWSELNSPDLDAAVAFYAKVFGYEVKQEGDGEQWDYRTFSVAGTELPLGGMMPLPAPDVPPHWGVYFAVADPDAALAKATELGGTVLREATDSPYGRSGVIQDPQGAVFTAMAPSFVPPDPV